MWPNNVTKAIMWPRLWHGTDPVNRNEVTAVLSQRLSVHFICRLVEVNTVVHGHWRHQGMFTPGRHTMVIVTLLQRIGFLSDIVSSLWSVSLLIRHFPVSSIHCCRSIQCNLRSSLTPVRKPVQLRSCQPDLLFVPKVNTCIWTRTFAVGVLLLVLNQLKNTATYCRHLKIYPCKITYPCSSLAYQSIWWQLDLFIDSEVDRPFVLMRLWAWFLRRVCRCIDDRVRSWSTCEPGAPVNQEHLWTRSTCEPGVPVNQEHLWTRSTCEPGAPVNQEHLWTRSTCEPGAPVNQEHLWTRNTCEPGVPVNQGSELIRSGGLH